MAQRENRQSSIANRDPAVVRELEHEVFELFPHGILVLDAGGSLIGWNATATRLLEPLEDGTRCCDLLGCRSSTGPLAGGCITELAKENSGALPEVRIDRPGTGGEGSSLWVTAAALRSDGGRLVVEVRPGDPGDRRRRTEPHWVSKPELRIRTFGSTRVDAREGPLTGDWLLQRSGQILLYIVSQRGRWVHSDAIAEAIWPQAELGASASLRYFVHALRHKIEPGRRKRAPSAFLVSRGGGYMLDPETVTIDVDEFEQRVRAGLLAFGRRDSAWAERELVEALLIYEGDFLADLPYAQWALAERDRLRTLATDALHTLAIIRSRAGDNDAAVAHLMRLCDLLPYDLEVHREMLSMLYVLGRRTEAAARYEELAARLSQTFGEEPDFSLADIRPEGSLPD